MNKEILVTGGTGCVGANLINHLNRRGIKPRVLMRRTSKTIAIDDLEWEPIIGDVTDPSSLADAVKGCDSVFHAAGIVSFWRKRKDEIMRVNVDGTRNVLEASKQAGVKKFVFTSSIAAIGYSEPPNIIVNEDSQWNYEKYGLVYNISKKQSEEYVLKGSNKDFQTFAINPGVIFGERGINLFSGRIFKIMKRHNMPLVLKGGNTISDADDVAEAHILAAEKGRPGERYIISSENMSDMKLYSIIAKIMGKKPPRGEMPKWLALAGGYISESVGSIIGREPNIVYGLAVQGNLYEYSSNAKAQKELGFKPTPVRVSLEKTYRWLLDHGII